MVATFDADIRKSEADVLGTIALVMESIRPSIKGSQYCIAVCRDRLEMIKMEFKKHW